MHKRNFTLQGGECLNDEDYSIMTFDVQLDDASGDISLLLPDAEELDAILGTSKWMLTQASAEALGRGASGRLEIVAPGGENAKAQEVSAGSCADEAGQETACGTGKLAW